MYLVHGRIIDAWVLWSTARVSTRKPLLWVEKSVLWCEEPGVRAGATSRAAGTGVAKAPNIFAYDPTTLATRWHFSAYFCIAFGMWRRLFRPNAHHLIGSSILQVRNAHGTLWTHSPHYFPGCRAAEWTSHTNPCRLIISYDSSPRRREGSRQEMWLWMSWELDAQFIGTSPQIKLDRAASFWCTKVSWRGEFLAFKPPS
jgi:hypothetical protein